VSCGDFEQELNTYCCLFDWLLLVLPTTCKTVGHALLHQQQMCLLLLEYVLLYIRGWPCSIEPAFSERLRRAHRRRAIAIAYALMLLGGHHSILVWTWLNALLCLYIHSEGAVLFPLLSIAFYSAYSGSNLMDNANSEGTFFSICKRMCINYSIKQIAYD